MTNNRMDATATDIMDLSCGNFSEDAFAMFINDDDFPGFNSLNSSNFFDQVMNASKLFDGEESLAKLNDSFVSLNKASVMNRLKKASPRRNLTRKTMPSSFWRTDLGQASFWVEESIDEEESEREETENKSPVDTEDFQAEILRAFILMKVQKIAQEQQRPHDLKCANDRESNTPATVSVSSNADTVVEATDNALGLADVARNAGDHFAESRRNRKSSKPKHKNKPKDDGESVATASESASSNENGKIADVTKKPFAGKRDSTQQKRVSKTKSRSRSEAGHADDLVSVAPSTASVNQSGNMSDVTKKALALANVVRGAEDAVRQVQESKMKRKSEPMAATKSSEDGGSVTTAAESVSSNESGHIADVTKKALALARVVSDTGDAIVKKEKRKVPQKHSTSIGRKKKAGQGVQEGETREPAQEKRRSSRGIGAKPRRRRAGSVDSRLRSMKDTSEMTTDTSSRRRPLDGSNRNNHAILREPTTPRRETIAVPSTPRRNQRFCAGRSRSFCAQATKEAHDLIAASPMTPRRNKTLPSERPTPSSEIRRVTREPRRAARRASLGHDMLKRNMILMDQEDKEDDAVSVGANIMGGCGKDKHDVWKQRRLRSFGDATDALAHQKTAMGRAATIQAATVALTTPRVAATKLCVGVDSAINRILLAGVENGKKKDDATRKATSKVTSKDDSCLPDLQRAPPATPVSQRRMRRRGSCSGT